MTVLCDYVVTDESNRSKVKIKTKKNQHAHVLILLFVPLFNECLLAWVMVIRLVAHPT